MEIKAKAISPSPAIECSSCELLAEYIIEGNDVAFFACKSSDHYENARQLVIGFKHTEIEHIPNLSFGGRQ